jgi:hypothetical protein
MELIRDDMFQAFASETDDKTAEAFFGYILYEHHFQPNEILDEIPDFYENLSNYLEDEDRSIEQLKQFADNQFIDYYGRRRRGF